MTIEEEILSQASINLMMNKLSKLQILTKVTQLKFSSSSSSSCSSCHKYPTSDRMQTIKPNHFQNHLSFHLNQISK